MYRISAIYNVDTGSHFDKDYYIKTHVPLAAATLDGHVNIKSQEVEWDVQQINWIEQESADNSNPVAFCRYSAIVETEEDVKDFFQFMKSANRETLHSDVPNYTDTHSVWTVSEIAYPSE